MSARITLVRGDHARISFNFETPLEHVECAVFSIESPTTGVIEVDGVVDGSSVVVDLLPEHTATPGAYRADLNLVVGGRVFTPWLMGNPGAVTIVNNVTRRRGDG